MDEMYRYPVGFHITASLGIFIIPSMIYFSFLKRDWKIFQGLFEVFVVTFYFTSVHLHCT